MTSSQPVRSLLRARVTQLPFGSTAKQAPASLRLYHRSPALLRPYKDDQDRESLKPRSGEHTKSGSDEDAAAQDDAAFNPKKTSPGKEKDTAAKDTEGSPLEVSGANQDISKPQGDNPSGKPTGDSGDKKKKSARHSAQKGGKLS